MAKINFYLLIISLMMCIACNQVNNNNTINTKDIPVSKQEKEAKHKNTAPEFHVSNKTQVAINTEVTESGDTLIIKGTCVVLYHPDSFKIEKFKKNEEDLYGCT
ncbi:MAG: hypothetical protein COC01_09980 [Bacteroidetes bacterium]|nr:MAG: hypothetical protein COC01_09980 [Bacteroidota bacterium]